jgi:hypothetical protein
LGKTLYSLFVVRGIDNKVISPFLIISTIWGLPSLTLLTSFTGMPYLSQMAAVPLLQQY